MRRSRWADDPYSSQNSDGTSFPDSPIYPYARGSWFTPPDMVVCTFYQRGNCRYGDNCRNEHPGSQRDANRGFSNQNRFAAFGGGAATGDRYRPGQQSGAFGGSRDTKSLPYSLNKDDMKLDLSDQRPIYPLSCYGPGRDAPRQLIEGPVEISPEELRWQYYQARTSGNEQAAQQQEAELHGKMQQQVQSILADMDGAIRYIEAGANIHPNRIDIVQGKAGAPTGPSASNSNAFSKPFGSGAPAQTSAFGQASTPGFGQPRANPFGQPSNPAQTTSAFGQPSNPGQTTSAFGQPSNPGQTTSAFGQASSLAAGSGFGKPAFGASAFGKPSVPGGGSAFGQPSNPGQGSAFGQPSAPGQTSAFEQANPLGQQASAFSKPAFGQSTFGQPAQPGASASPFGQPAQPQANPSPFGQQAQQSSQPSPFGQQPQKTNPFGQAQNQQTPSQPNPFGQPQNQQTSTQPNPFGGAPAAPSAFGTPSLPQNQNTAAQNPFAQKPPGQGQAANPFGQPQQSASPFAQQAPQGGSNQFNDKDRFKEGKPEEYEGERGRVLEEIYKRVAQTGRFEPDEEIPMTPPKCEWIVPVQML